MGEWIVYLQDESYPGSVLRVPRSCQLHSQKFKWGGPGLDGPGMEGAVGLHADHVPVRAFLELGPHQMLRGASDPANGKLPQPGREYLAELT